MKRKLTERLERLVDGLASGAFGAAVGILVYHLPAPAAAQPVQGGYVAGTALIAYGMSRWLLGLVPGSLATVPVARVEPLNGPASVPTSGLERDEDRELDSGIVVHLFDPAVDAASKRPEIDLPAGAPGDATHSLHEALSQLRQSLASRR